MMQARASATMDVLREGVTGLMSTRRCLRRLVAAVVLFALAASVMGVVLALTSSPAQAAGSCSTTAGTTTCTFSPTGAEDTFTVPDGVSSVHVVATGAPGAVGQDGGTAGRGARVSGDLAVTPGDTLYVEVGGAPTGSGTSNCYPPIDCIGGFNGGGTSRFGGGGGGASDVRTVARDQDGSLDSRLIVAAGGGGSGEGWFCAPSPSGGYGGDAGSAGGDGDTCYSTPGGTGGGAGGQSAGGLGGSPRGQSGSLGLGGNGGGGTGGGGGGGLYGGGGGNLTLDLEAGDLVPAGGGGGGSNLVPDGGNATIANDGPSVTISYTVPDTTLPTLSIGHTPDGTHGWNKTSPATLNVSASDSGSGLAGAPTCKDGTTDLTLTAATAGNWTASVSGEGTHTVSCSVSDDAGNITTGTDTVKIDATAPSVSCSVSPSTLRLPANNHKLVTITASVSVTDSGSGADGFTLLSVTSNQEDSSLAKDDVPNDIQGWGFGTNDTSGQLRAERYGKDRIYTLTYQGKDLAGNTKNCQATVTVRKG